MFQIPPGLVDQLALNYYGTTGRTGHITVKITKASDDSVWYGPADPGFEEEEAGFYDVDQFTFPSAAGVYNVFYYDDGVLITGAADAFQVTYSQLTAFAPTGSDLTTLANAKSWLAITDASQDSRLQQLITAASHAVMEYAQREFAPNSGSGVTRQFALKRDGLVTFGNCDLQAASIVQIDTEPGGSPTTLTQDQYQLWPIDAPHGVYRGIRFYTFAVGPVLRQWFGLYRHFSVTGMWGFPSIPADVEQATLITVAKWFKRDETAWSNELPYPNTSTGNELPLDAIRLVQPYKRFV